METSKGQSALVSQDEVREWSIKTAANGFRERVTFVLSVSHCWESKEHPDPYGHQLQHLVEQLDKIEDTAVMVSRDTGKRTLPLCWVFFDYVSLHQFARNDLQQQAYDTAMKNIQVLYAHECTRTLRIDTLTPMELKEQHGDGMITIYHLPSGKLKEVACKELTPNTTPYSQRGWCEAELQWSGTRNYSVRWYNFPAVQIRRVAMAPQDFRQRIEDDILKFTHRDDKVPVTELQARVFNDKAKLCQTLRLSHLDAQDFPVLANSLPHYTSLQQLDLSGNASMGSLETGLLAAALKEPLAVYWITLSGNPLGDSGAAALAEVLKVNTRVSRMDLNQASIKDSGCRELALALAQNSSLSAVKSVVYCIMVQFECAYGIVHCIMLKCHTIQCNSITPYAKMFSTFLSKPHIVRQCCSYRRCC